MPLGRLGVALAFLLGACDNCGTKLTSTAPQCRPAPCDDGETRCQNGCVPRPEKGTACSAALDCKAPVCADGLVCHDGVCQEGKKQLDPCSPGAEECAVGLYCVPVRALRPVKPNDPPGFCVPWLTEGQRCVAPSGDRLTCEPGLACVNGICRRPCATHGDCPCGRGELCLAADSVAPGDPAGGNVCFDCADTQIQSSWCSAERPCCREGLACAASTLDPTGPARCCAPPGIPCLDRNNCCAPGECQADPQTGSKSCCVPEGDACNAGDRCCAGTCCGGRCVDCDVDNGYTLDDETCECRLKTCDVIRRCPNGGRPDPLSCTCECFDEASGALEPCCPQDTKDCGLDSVPRCVGQFVPCPPYCWRQEGLLGSCPAGTTCCGGGCLPYPYVSCCSDWTACPEDSPVCCGDWCCPSGTRCCGTRMCCVG